MERLFGIYVKKNCFVFNSNTDGGILLSKGDSKNVGAVQAQMTDDDKR